MRQGTHREGSNQKGAGHGEQPIGDAAWEMATRKRKSGEKELGTKKKKEGLTRSACQSQVKRIKARNPVSSPKEGLANRNGVVYSG